MSTMLVRPGLWVSSSGEYQIMRVRQPRKMGGGFKTAWEWKVRRWTQDTRQYEDIPRKPFATLSEARKWVALSEQAPF